MNLCQNVYYELGECNKQLNQSYELDRLDITAKKDSILVHQKKLRTVCSLWRRLQGLLQLVRQLNASWARWASVRKRLTFFRVKPHSLDTANHFNETWLACSSLSEELNERKLYVECEINLLIRQCEEGTELDENKLQLEKNEGWLARSNE